MPALDREAVPNAKRSSNQKNYVHWITTATVERDPGPIAGKRAPTGHSRFVTRHSTACHNVLSLLTGVWLGVSSTSPGGQARRSRDQ